MCNHRQEANQLHFHEFFITRRKCQKYPPKLILCMKPLWKFSQSIIIQGYPMIYFHHRFHLMRKPNDYFRSFNMQILLLASANKSLFFVSHLSLGKTIRTVRVFWPNATSSIRLLKQVYKIPCSLLSFTNESTKNGRYLNVRKTIHFVLVIM